MAGPSIVVRVLGDMTGLSTSMKNTEATAASTTGRLRTAFNGVLGVLNKTGVLGPFQDSLDAVSNTLDTMSEHGKRLGTTLMGIGGTAAGLGAGLAALGSKDQAAHAQLQGAIQATGHSYEQYGAQVDKAIKSQEHFGHNAVDTQDALTTLTSALNSPTAALKNIGLAADLAARNHESLDAAAMQLAKTYNGSSRLLKEFGIATVPKLTTAQKQLTTATNGVQTAQANLASAQLALQTVQDQYAGKTHLTALEQDHLTAAQDRVTAASAKLADAHTKEVAAQAQVQQATQGSSTIYDQLSAKLHGDAADAANTFTGHIKAITTAMEDQVAQIGAKYGPAITAVGSVVGVAGGVIETFTKAQQAMTTATEAGTAAEDAATVSEGAMLGPILLIIAAVAALGVGIYELVTHWSTVWAAMKAAVAFVWDWIKKNWPLLVDIIMGPMGIVVTQVIEHWKVIKDTIVGAFNDVVNLAKSLPAKITSALTGMWDVIFDTFRDVINHVIDLWDMLHFKLPAIHLPFGLGHFGGETFGVPHIPHLAQGGLITSSGIVYAHAGEVITPAPAGAGGPAMHIEHATFNEPVDVELLMKKLEFAIMAGLPV